ncbi:MAG: tRNA epoxyqueuosine(34) reductase QueG [Acidobacteria bacterium]|nr:tRNA epoxyqueuosine(34) reductase QueG [Acidobacteriota bacterium]MCW5950023.1 tRNA epoxyqueuosine(34) reductase QueG [Pyrinomonadaceae bacterium]
MSLRDDIKQYGRELGFHRVGIAHPDVLQNERARLSEWLQLNYHGTMHWMERDPELRSDPSRLMENIRSIVVVVHNYYTPHEHTHRPGTGKISRYAWGDDYHDVIRDKLDDLLSFIKDRVGQANGKICVDTAPFMDKAWAVRAGLGWIGKHSNLITREVGSWVFIGSLLLDIELDPDPPMAEDHCGTCTACIDECPTGAIVEPYVVDSRRCISFGTIEFRGETLPDGITKDLDGWIYGCDVCQDVCPWNRFQEPSNESRFEPRNQETSLDLAMIADLTHEEYLDRFRGSPIKRAKLSGLKRNAAALLECDDTPISDSKEYNRANGSS